MVDQPRNTFDIVRMEVQGHPVVVLYGELDALAAPRLHEGLGEIIGEAPSCILVDLANVTFIDSSALGALVVAHRHLADAGGELRLVAVPEVVAKVFEITQLSKRFHIFNDVEAATKATPTEA